MRQRRLPWVALGTALLLSAAIAGALAQPVIGKILDLNSVVVIHQETGERIFNLAQYQEALLFLPIALALSLGLLCFLKETNCRPISN